MIRHKLGITVAGTMLLAGLSRAEEPHSARLGIPQQPQNYTARGMAPNPGYPKRNANPSTALPPMYDQPLMVLPKTQPVHPPEPIPLPLAAPVATAPAATLAAPRVVLIQVPTMAPMAVAPTVASSQSAVAQSSFATQDQPESTVPPAPLAMPMPATAQPMPPNTPPTIAVPMIAEGTGPLPTYTVLPEGLMMSPTGGEIPTLSNGLFGSYIPQSMPSIWFSSEYMRWSGRGMKIPALATSSTGSGNGTLGARDTVVLYGHSKILDGWSSGYRLRGGLWIDDRSGIDVGYFNVGRQTTSFAAESSGNPKIFRPFFNVNRTEDVALVAFPGTLAGRLNIQATSEIWGGEINYRSMIWSDPLNRFDYFVGYRFLSLKDTLNAQAASTVIAANGPDLPGTTLDVFDNFTTRNQFHGAQVGLTGETQYGKWSLGYRASVGLGVTSQKTMIAGNTVAQTPGQAPTNSAGGLLALSSNIGSYNDTRFSVVPDISLMAGYQLTDSVRLFGSYNFMWWSSVIRAGDQVDRVINPALIPPSTPTSIHRPAELGVDSCYFLQGWTVGLEFRW